MTTTLPPKIAPGSRVCLHLYLGLPDGTEAISTFDGEPLCFTLGDGTLAEGLEMALYGLRQGSREELRIPGDLVYGLRDPASRHQVPLASFPPGITPAPGLVVAFADADGRETPATIQEIDGEAAQVDFNHPLSGRDLVLRVQVLSVAPAEGAAE
jgi:FKBP-type peptidyl-prolyl cis-trans isomerase SlpA